MPNTVNYRKAALLVSYLDHSELLYLSDEKRYVWMRPNADRTAMHETRIDVNSHGAAILVTRAKVRKVSESSLK
jgi:hypothetical protein